MTPNDYIRDLQAAARAAAEHCAHQSATSVAVFGGGTQLLINVAVPAGPDSKGKVPEPPPLDAPGWHVTDRAAALDGTPVALTRRQLDVLRVLVGCDIASADDLRAAWDGYPAEEGTIRWQVGELRKALKRQFGDFPGDLIESTGTGYRLLLR